MYCIYKYTHMYIFKKYLRVCVYIYIYIYTHMIYNKYKYILHIFLKYIQVCVFIFIYTVYIM